MRVLFATGEPYVPEIFGGAECSMDQLARELGRRGHDCVVVAAARGRTHRWRRQLDGWLGRAARADTVNGYRTFRPAAPRVPATVARLAWVERPDLIVCWNSACAEIATAAVQMDVPVLVWVPDVNFERYLDHLPHGRHLALAACSPFVATRLAARTGADVPVLRPTLRREDFVATEHHPEHLTLINAGHHKGLAIALAIAAQLPHRPLVLVESWQNRLPARLALRAQLAGAPNVRLRPKVRDVRTIYARTSVLLAPSQLEDASPRVIVEANSNGIPVVASAIGGIPELVGNAGVLCRPDAPTGDWAKAIESILCHPTRRAEHAARARINAARPEFQPDTTTAQFLALAEDLRKRVRVRA